ncbi:MAG: M20/M25/M40 family metallo-hydrolase [Deltaproteobacteria bacterium]|nr:MAG: M20/M25/M40 family metallo-hydrolase [Deltaproteobacteria bacterium]
MYRETIPAPRVEKIYAAINRGFPEHLEQCRAFLRQKSISATGEGIRETAEWVRHSIEELGGEVDFWGNPSFPIVFGRLDRGCPKTLIIYGMYDVQPAEEPNWISPPFAAEIHQLPGFGECVLARGAVNSKGALCGLFNVLKTIKDEDEIPLNLIFTIEGEEEVGSPQLEEFILSHREELNADGVVDFDFSQDTRGKVSMHLGLKGIVYLDLICRGGKRGGPTETSLHGSVSAWISSPVWRLIHALGSLTDKRENIRIPGFYENVASLSKEDLRLLKRLEKTFDEKAFLKEMKSLCFKYDRHGIDLLKRGLYSPIININGFHAGYDGSGTKTVLPRRASAKIDVRFGPRMEPDEVKQKLESYLLSQGFDDIEIKIRDCYSWSKTDFKEPIVQQMIHAYRLLGSQPEVWPIATWAAPYFVFSRILGLPVVSGGLGNGGRQHVANEYMSVRGLKDFETFVATFLYLLVDESKEPKSQ